MKEEKRKSQLKGVATTASVYEVTQRYGEAGSQHLIGLRGVNHQIDDPKRKFLDRSLEQISRSKINPEYAEQNIKQQAGYSAEVAGVSRRNADAIINKTGVKTCRSEDAHKNQQHTNVKLDYGKNHPKVDLVEIMPDGTVVESQMKFVTNGKKLLKNIACGKNNLSRYMEVDKLDVPTEQVEEMKKFCEEQSQELKQQAKNARVEGKIDVANKKLEQAKNYEKLKDKISDSGLSTDEAIFYRTHPRLAVAKDIVKVSHRSGVQGAKFGAAIGGSLSAISNVIACASGDKEFSDALLDTTKDTLVSAGVGYVTAFGGTTIKSVMTQSSSATIRNLSNTNLPAQIINMVTSTAGLIKQYIYGEIDGETLVIETGAVASTMASSALFTTIGQIAIPIPVLGGIIGSMIGYALTNNFYRNFFEALNDVKLARERRQQIEMECIVAKMAAESYEKRINELFDTRLTALNQGSKSLFNALNNKQLSSEEFCKEINDFALQFGKSLPIKNMAELEEVMLSDKPLII